MARSRNIKPGFFKNEHLAELDPLARILFAGLWTLADREGRLEDRPKRIKADVLPYDNCDIDTLLNSLANNQEQFIIRYEVNGERYIQIKNFLRHQHPHIKEQASIIPAPDMHCINTVQKQDEHGSCPSDSLNPHTDSLNPHMVTFEYLWSLYPKKKGKGKISEAQKKKLHKIGVQKIEACIERYKKETTGKEEQFIQHGSTFLNSGYVDYLDENYTDKKPSKDEKEKPIISGWESVNMSPNVRALMEEQYDA